MKSLVVKRSIVIDGHRTSVTIEEAFWKGLHEIAHERDMGVNRLIASIDRNRQFANLSSTIRLFVLAYYRGEHEREQAVSVTAEAAKSMSLS
jgi:predicted DNA-binding ribbon-helix-helix protein